MMYVHAVQSTFWNQVVSEIVKEDNYFEVPYSQGVFRFSEKYYDASIPLIGFGTEFEHKQVQEAYQNIMKKHGLCKRDFIINQIPELSSEGSERVMDVMINNLAINKINENTYRIKFDLPKGSYATIVIKKLFKS